MAASIKSRVNWPVDQGMGLGFVPQRGNMMLEAVVGLAIGATLGLAMAWGAAQALHSQKFSSTQSMLVFAMRQNLSAASSPLRGTSAAVSISVPASGSPMTLSGVKSCDAAVPISMTVNGVSGAVNYQKPCELSTDNTAANQSVVGGGGAIKF